MDSHKIPFRELIASNPLARNSAIVFAGTMTANVLSYIYHLMMGRMLGPSGYGELSSLLSLLYIFTIPLLVTQTVLIKLVSGFKAHGEVGQAKSLFIKAVKVFEVVSLVGFPVILLAAPWVTSFLHLSSSTLFVYVYLLLIISLFIAVATSMLAGYQKFIWVSILGSVAILVKIVISVPMAGWRVSGVMLAAIMASLIACVLYILPLRFLMSVKRKPTHLKKRDTFGFAIPTLLTQLGITSLYTTDIILVRHFFDAQSSGLYAALAILGKIIFYASSAVPTVLFPIASERTALGSKTKKLIISAVGAVAVISIGITALYFLFPDLIVSLLFGNAYAGAGAMLGMFGIFLGLFSIANSIAVSCLAVGKIRIWLFCVAAALAQIVGVTIFHGTIAQVIYLNIAIAAVLTFGSAAYYLYEKIQPHHTGV